MSLKRIGPIAQAWYKWKALRLPWRKRFFIGHDLHGNTFWEFRLTRGPDDGAASVGDRWRRIVTYPRSTHLSEVRVSPLWHQWLRHTRADPPSIAEQQGDVVRQERMRLLAAQADARWEAKPRVMEDPAAAAQRRALPPREPEVRADARPEEEDAKRRKSRDDESAAEGGGKTDPWAKAKAKGPSEDWQPTAWSPTATRKG